MSVSASTPRRRRSDIPATRVISPSPTPSERQALQDRSSDGDASGSGSGSYNGPMTRAARKRLSTPQPVEEDPSGEEEEKRAVGGGGGAKGAKGARAARATANGSKAVGSPGSSDGNGTADRRRARTRSRSPIVTRQLGELTPVVATGTRSNGDTAEEEGEKTKKKKKKSKPAALEAVLTNGSANGHLRPPGQEGTVGGWSWRDFSRSPSPLGLIPIHRHWRSFVHRHEVPRKALHVSIGLLVAWLYASGTQTRAVCPYLMGALVPIASVDVLRHRWAAFNRLYVRVLGALMRESEFDGYNGVIFYLLGAWAVLYALPKDVAVVSVMLLSWCDTAASTFGRLWGRYTPRLRRGKSLAGSSAAFVVGVATAAWFWGWLAPTLGPMPGDDAFQFRGSLGLPPPAVAALSRVLDRVLGPENVPQSVLAAAATRVSGAIALGIVSVWSGFVAAASEVVDLFGWDDNLTIPVLSGAGIWAFLRVFG